MLDASSLFAAVAVVAFAVRSPPLAEVAVVVSAVSRLPAVVGIVVSAVGRLPAVVAVVASMMGNPPAVVVGQTQM